uniref:Uncharacterized protein n=1 Tax=Macrostomum lignano TaxID=282301 RepID=A0A1I8F991_9PLAT
AKDIGSQHKCQPAREGQRRQAGLHLGLPSGCRSLNRPSALLSIEADKKLFRLILGLRYNRLIDPADYFAHAYRVLVFGCIINYGINYCPRLSSCRGQENVSLLQRQQSRRPALARLCGRSGAPSDSRYSSLTCPLGTCTSSKYEFPDALLSGIGRSVSRYRTEQGHSIRRSDDRSPRSSLVVLVRRQHSRVAKPLRQFDSSLSDVVVEAASVGARFRFPSSSRMRIAV